jgi:CRISPR/Cas system-associated exonuclease Cas4 (RecB family)
MKEQRLIISLLSFGVDITGIIVKAVEELKREFSAGRLEPGVSHIAACLRYAFYVITRGKPIGDIVLYGTELHHWFSRHAPPALERHGCKCRSEVKVTLGRLSGFADMLCDCSGVRAVIELKFTKTPNASNPFFRWHERQLKYYAAIAGADIGMLLMMSFDLQRYSVFHVTLDDESRRALAREALARYEDLVHALASGVPPEPERGPYCPYCPYRRECLNERLA